jgi:hypothetical protein
LSWQWEKAGIDRTRLTSNVVERRSAAKAGRRHE